MLRPQILTWRQALATAGRSVHTKLRCEISPSGARLSLQQGERDHPSLTDEQARSVGHATAPKSDPGG